MFLVSVKYQNFYPPWFRLPLNCVPCEDSIANVVKWFQTGYQ